MSKTFGVATVGHLLNHLPAFHSIAFYRYSQTSWELAVIVLAAFGIDDMARRSLRPVLIVGAGVVSLGVIAWAAAQAWPVMTSAKGYSHAPRLHCGQRRPGGRRCRRRGDWWPPFVRRGRPRREGGSGGSWSPARWLVEAAVLFAAPAALGTPARAERHGPGALPAATHRPLPLRHLGPDTAQLRLVFRVGRDQRERPARPEGTSRVHREITRRQRRPADLHRNDRVRSRRPGPGPRAARSPGGLRSRRGQVRRDPGVGGGRHRVPVAAEPG